MGHLLELKDGILYSTGDNQYGQLGIGNVNDTPLTHKVITGKEEYDSIPWIEAKTGENHSVAIKQDKSIWMWGSNIEGQMGLPENIKYLTLPTKTDFNINASKDIDLNIGMYFTIISQIGEKSYGLGTFQNLGSKIVTLNRQIVPLYYTDPNGENFLTVEAGPKTIIARISSGLQVYSDWSGDLIARDFTTFDQLYVGDYFTLFDPENRERLLYKKVDTYQQDAGCCKVNALCMHRKYRELVSQVEAVYPEVKVFVLSDLLDPKTRPKVVSSKDQYGTEFVFYSVLAGIDYMGTPYPKNLDPFTLKGLMLATGTKSLLDVILFGGLHFTDNLSDEFNNKTSVERISAKEVFRKGAFPSYFEDVGRCKILPGDSYTLHPEFANTYTAPNYSSAPLYFFKLNDKSQPIKYSTANRYYLPFKDLSVTYNELESEPDLFNLFFNGRESFFRSRPNPKDPTDPIIYRENVDLPADSNNRITVEDLFFTPPYLIKQELSEGKSSFSQNFTDPYVRVKAQQPDDPIINCNSWNGSKSIDPELTKWLYACNVVVDAFAASGRSYITYNIGPDADKLIKYFIDPKTDPELTKQFFGFTKIELEELYDTIRNGEPDVSNNPAVAAKYEKVVGDSFRLLRDVFNTQIQGKIYFDAKTNMPIFKTSANTLSSQPQVNMLNGLVVYTRTGPLYTHHYIKIPTEKIICYTYFTKTLESDENNNFKYKYRSDRQTLIVPIDVRGKIVPGNTKVCYWVRTAESTPAEDKIVKQTLNVRVLSVQYESALNITKIALDKPLTAPYLIGCTRVPGQFGTVCGPSLYIDIYYNANNFNMIQALLN